MDKLGNEICIFPRTPLNIATMPPIVVRNIIDITLIDITLLPCSNTARLERVIAGEGGHGVDNVATVDSCFFYRSPRVFFLMHSLFIIY